MQLFRKSQLNFQDIMVIGTFVNVQQDIQELLSSLNIFLFQWRKIFLKNNILKKVES